MNPPVPTAVSPYAFSERALRRWARENLTCTPRADGGGQAMFRFEGSTCGNIAFHLLYRVSFGPPGEGRRLEALHCEPAPHSENHARMCCWQLSATAAAAIMRDEAPLLGEPLHAVLAWRPEKSPAGCLCDAPSRSHKWQAVLETLHYALHAAPAQPSLS